MSDPRYFTERQRAMLLDLACQPPGRWCPAGPVATVRSLQRRGLVEQRESDGHVRLAHNSAGQVPA